MSSIMENTGSKVSHSTTHSIRLIITFAQKTRTSHSYETLTSFQPGVNKNLRTRDIDTINARVRHQVILKAKIDRRQIHQRKNGNGEEKN